MTAITTGAGLNPGAIGDAGSRHAPHEEGYEKSLKPRQVQMIAIGGAIGTGLFLGAGARLQLAGPALAAVYLFCGLFSFLILRALGELVMYRPTSGSFVSYSREFYGEKGSYIAGWLYYLNWAMTGIVDITAVALYMKYCGNVRQLRRSGCSPSSRSRSSGPATWSPSNGSARWNSGSRSSRSGLSCCSSSSASCSWSAGTASAVMPPASI